MMMLGVDDDHSVNYEKGQRPTKRKKKTTQLFPLLPYSARRDGRKHTATTARSSVRFRFSRREICRISFAHTLTKKTFTF